MFLLVAHALAGSVVIGWPCQRLNWAWRNVWSTCSINSYAPFGTSEANIPAQTPTGFRFTASPQIAGTSTYVLNNGGVFTPATGAAPALLCAAASNTGSGSTAVLRNRCRRAIDAYGGLVRACQSPAGGNRGPNSLSPDYLPSAGHVPHVSNVAGLTQNAQFCLLPYGTVGTPGALATPSTTCPGLLGWFTVVFNVCGFSNAPGLNTPNLNAPNSPSATPLNVGTYFTPGLGLNYGAFVNGASVSGTGSGYFCNNAAAPPSGIPSAYNPIGPTFRTSRCRKALDQFGRTANRCDKSLAATPPGSPSQAGGYSDPLRLLAVGAPSGSPNGFNTWAPNCN